MKYAEFGSKLKDGESAKTALVTTQARLDMAATKMQKPRSENKQLGEEQS